MFCREADRRKGALTITNHQKITELAERIRIVADAFEGLGMEPHRIDNLTASDLEAAFAQFVTNAERAFADAARRYEGAQGGCPSQTPDNPT